MTNHDLSLDLLGDSRVGSAILNVLLFDQETQPKPEPYAILSHLVVDVVLVSVTSVRC